MITVKSFEFNPFQVKTYVLHDVTGECVIIDAGCVYPGEEAILENYITEKKLKPVLLLSTHTHLDHIPGNKFVIDKYAIPYKVHEKGLGILSTAQESAIGYGFPLKEVVTPDSFLVEGEKVRFGHSELIVLYTPGHADGSICLYGQQDNFVIVGDVLFHGSIGRSDFPTGNHELLLKNIREKLFNLPDDTKVYSGHGPATSIGQEKSYNPFF